MPGTWYPGFTWVDKGWEGGAVEKTESVLITRGLLCRRLGKHMADMGLLR